MLRPALALAPLLLLAGCGKPPAPVPTVPTIPSVPQIVVAKPEEKIAEEKPGNPLAPAAATPQPDDGPISKAEKEAEDYVTKFGGFVSRDVSHNSKGQPVFAISIDGKDVSKFELKKLALFPKLHRLTFSGTKNTDAVLKQLPDLPNITLVSLEASDVTDTGLIPVVALPKLKELDLMRAEKLTPKGFQVLATSKTLEELIATETAIDDTAIRTLGAVKTLTKLTLRGTKVKLADTGAAFSGWAKLSHLDLADTPIDDGALVPIGVAKALTELQLEGTAITDAGLKPLGKLSRLKLLHLGRCAQITGVGLGELNDLAELEKLYLNDTALSDLGMIGVAKAKSLKTLNLDRTKVTDTGVKELANPRALETLDFEETSVGDAGLIALAEKAKKLERVGVRKSKVTETGATEARAKGNNLSISFE
jgi:internalin A